MRIGFNPHKDVLHEPSEFIHQVIIPVYIPGSDGYFKDAFRIFRMCIESLLKTTHGRTFISVVNNGSCKEIADYVNELFENDQVHEVIHSENIGKLNAILKGLAGNNIELVTICDADTLFLSGWQQETVRIFSRIPKAGVVGIVPQFQAFRHFCGNAIFDNLLNKKMAFLPVKNPDAMQRFYDSLGWKRDYNPDLLKYVLGLSYPDGLKTIIGSGHFAATYKKDIFTEITTYLGYKLGGDTETYLDEMPLEKDYWRLTTYDNYAYHMGNVAEDWMQEALDDIQPGPELGPSGFAIRRRLNPLIYLVKNKIFIRFLKVKWMYRIFLGYAKLPKDIKLD